MICGVTKLWKAQNTYERDTGEKLTGYAKAGIKQYIVINLRARTAEIYAPPAGSSGTYPAAQIVSENATIPIRVGDVEFFTPLLPDLLP